MSSEGARAGSFVRCQEMVVVGFVNCCSTARPVESSTTTTNPTIRLRCRPLSIRTILIGFILYPTSWNFPSLLPLHVYPLLIRCHSPFSSLSPENVYVVQSKRCNKTGREYVTCEMKTVQRTVTVNEMALIFFSLFYLSPLLLGSSGFPVNSHTITATNGTITITADFLFILHLPPIGPLPNKLPSCMQIYSRS